MAGVTDAGFIIKRLADILADDRALAVQLFQDLVQPGDQVDTSDSSALGRLISLAAPSEADLWEAAQEVYAAFDPNSATGIALDNLVALGGITRQERTFSSAQAIFSGDNGILIPLGLTIGSAVDASQWSIVAPVALSPSAATGITVTPLIVADSTLYTITYTSVSTTNTISYTSGVGATATSIIAGLAGVVLSSHPTLVGSVQGTNLTLTRVDEFAVVTFSTSMNLGITKCQKIGEVVATVAGLTTAEVNTLTIILTPQLGWDSVTNPTPASPGRDREADEELRLRFRETKFERASNIIEALYSALINLSGVTQVVIYENDTDTIDALGIPPHSFMPIILGGLSNEVAETVWENKPMGIRSFGDTIVNITDSQGFTHAIGFKRPDPVPVYISMTLTTNSEFPATGSDDIKTALINYFDQNIGIGDDVVYSRLYTPINTVNGHQIDSLTIGTSPSPVGTSNITITFEQLATLDSSNILISV